MSSPFFDCQSIAQPPSLRPIVFIGAGGIVQDAHLPAYQKRNIPVHGIFDIEFEKASTLSKKWAIPHAFKDLESACQSQNVILDIAVPPSQILPILSKVPDESIVFIQKPMGENLAQAQEILSLCRQKKLVAAVNFQLKFSPMMLAIKQIIQSEKLGTITDIEYQLNVNDPWHLFPFLEKLDRVEIQLHSTHYLDTLYSFFGLPQSVYALTLPDPRFPRLKSTRSSILLNYGQNPRCLLSLNHNYTHGGPHERSFIKVEGTEGVLFGKNGVMLNYPQGEPDTLEVKFKDQPFEFIPLVGNWFPDAFGNSMMALQQHLHDPQKYPLLHSIENSLDTMRLVEACYLSHQSQGTPIPS